MTTTYIVETYQGDRHRTTNIKDYVDVDKEVDNRIGDDDADEPQTQAVKITIAKLLKGTSFENPFPKRGIYKSVEVHYKPENTIEITGVNAFIGPPRQSARNAGNKRKHADFAPTIRIRLN